MRAVRHRILEDDPLLHVTLPLVAVALMPLLWHWNLLGNSSHPSSSWVRSTGGLFGGLFVALLAWTLGHGRGLWSAGTGAGFPLAAFGLVCREWAQFLVHFPALSADVSFEPYLLARAGWLFRIHEVGGVLAYAYGLALVALACAIDRRQRRCAPDWVMRPAPHGDRRAARIWRSSRRPAEPAPRRRAGRKRR